MERHAAPTCAPSNAPAVLNGTIIAAGVALAAGALALAAATLALAAAALAATALAAAAFAAAGATAIAAAAIAAAATAALAEPLAAAAAAAGFPALERGRRPPHRHRQPVDPCTGPYRRARGTKRAASPPPPRPHSQPLAELRPGLRAVWRARLAARYYPRSRHAHTIFVQMRD